MKTTAIACRCGAVRLEISGDPLAQFYCHCDDCQALHGAAYVGESVYPAAAVQIVSGEPGSWTLRRNPRFFCRDCATRLFIDVLARGWRGVNGHLLPAGALVPEFHMHCAFAVRPIHDGLPHYRALAPKFGGPDERVDW